MAKRGPLVFGGIVAIIDFLLRLGEYCNSQGPKVSVLAENQVHMNLG